jgi:methylphosphotriester-DNA--protein-cysteine methyltransferase
VRAPAGRRRDRDDASVPACLHAWEEARQLLAEGDQSIKQIAASIGYVHASHFATTFRNHFRVRP